MASSDKRSSFVAAAVGLLVVGALAGWVLRGLLAPAAASETEAEDQTTAVAPEQMAAAVRTARVRTGDLPQVITAVGTVRADARAELALSGRAGGRIVELLVRPGEELTRGQVLLRFDELPLRAERERAASALASASSDLEAYERSGRARQEAEFVAAAATAAADASLADDHLAQLEPLHADGLVPDRELAQARQDAARTRRDQALAESALAAWRGSLADLRHATLAAARDAARQDLEQAGAALADAELKAPADGRLVALTVREGDRVEPTAPVGTLLASEARVLHFGVTPAAAAGLHPGARVTWSDPAGEPVSGAVAALPEPVDPATGLVDVLAVPDAGQPAGRPGDVVRGELQVGTFTGALLLPEQAVVRQEDATTVHVVDADSIAHLVPVTVLGRHAGLAAVQGALQTGDRVIVEGGYNLPDGAHVVARPADASPADGAGR